MVPSTLRVTLGILLVACSVRADLQLMPETQEYELDGIKMQRLLFFDGPQRITYTPPRGWDYQGSSNRFVLHPTKGPRGEATITRTGLAQPQVFDEETLKRLSEEALASLPSGATRVAIVSQEKNPLIIEHKETFFVVINFDLNGEPLTRSVMFLNRKNEQLRFQLTCRRPDFPNLDKAFKNSHYSWQNL